MRRLLELYKKSVNDLSEINKKIENHFKITAKKDNSVDEVIKTSTVNEKIAFIQKKQNIGLLNILDKAKNKGK